MLHPLSQIDALESKVGELDSLGDRDGVIECRIHQLALTQLLVDVHDFPISAACQQHCLLSEAYSMGGYVAQALDHVHYGQQIVEAQIYDNGPCNRLGSSLALAEGLAYVSEGKNYDLALKALQKAATLIRQAYGSEDLQLARAHELLGKVTTIRKEYPQSLEHLSQAWEIREHCLGLESEQTLLLWLDMAWVHHLAGEIEDARSLQQSVVDRVLKLKKFPQLLVDASLRLSKWSETRQGLELLKNVEKILLEIQADQKTNGISGNNGAGGVLNPSISDNAKLVEIKREIALLLIKRREHDRALEYLGDVQFLERELYGSTSIQVARTLKALGTVYILKGANGEAHDCLIAALQIFESHPSVPHQVIKDLQNKLQSIT